MRMILAALVLALPACAGAPQWTPADTQPIREAKMTCAAATYEAVGDPTCSTAYYRFVSGQPSLSFRNDPGGAPRCSYVDMNRYAGQFMPSYQQCLAKAGVAP